MAGSAYDAETVKRLNNRIGGEPLHDFCPNNGRKTDWAVSHSTEVAGTGFAGEKWYRWHKTCSECGTQKLIYEYKGAS